MARTPFLDCDEIVTLGLIGGYNNNPALSQMSAVLLLSMCHAVKQRWIWQNPIAPIDDIDYERILEIIETAEADLMTSFAIGQIIASVAVLNELNLLEMNGQSVAQADYPELASRVPSSWLVGTDIQLPNLNDTGLFGTDTSAVRGTFVGENQHTLTDAEIPSHNHTQNPHSHTEVIPVVTPTFAGEIPGGASLVVPTPSVTGLATAINNPSGGGGAHNNIQNSMLVLYYIVSQ